MVACIRLPRFARALLALAVVLALFGAGLPDARAAAPRPSAGTRANAVAAAKIDRLLTTQTEGGATTRLFVRLTQEADLTAAAATKDRAARKAAVVAALRGTADRTQGGIRGLLTRRGVRFTPYWATNTI